MYLTMNVYVGIFVYRTVHMYVCIRIHQHVSDDCLKHETQGH